MQDFIKKAQKTPPVRIAVAAAGDREVLEGIKMADERGIIKPILIGNQGKIKDLLKELKYSFTGEIINTKNKAESAAKAMELIARNEADLPMKGFLDSKTILKAVLDKCYKIKEDNLLSLITLVFLEKDKRAILITDSGMNIAPGLSEKVEIINNAVSFAKKIGINEIKVAVLAAVEKVNPAMPVTIDAACLAKMSDRGQIKDAVVDGPLALDNILSIKAARNKGIDSSVAGRANIILVPDIEAGNILYKSLVNYCGLDSASVVMGAKVPLILTSRADSPVTRFNSIVLAKLVFEN